MLCGVLGGQRFWLVTLYHNNLLANQALWSVECVASRDLHVSCRSVGSHRITSRKEKVWGQMGLFRTMKVPGEMVEEEEVSREQVPSSWTAGQAEPQAQWAGLLCASQLSSAGRIFFRALEPCSGTAYGRKW